MRLFGTRRIYLDYASAPPVLGEAEAAMREASQFVGNPGAIHTEGVEAKRALQDARERIALLLAVKARELIFTSGLTEANNIAILGYARMLERTRRTLEGTHWIVSSIEHTSVLDCFAEIERMGGRVTHLPPNKHGIITADSVLSALTKETVLVSIGWANNEIGTVQPLGAISEGIRAFEAAEKISIMLHTDAGQAPLYLSTAINSVSVDLCAIGGNKLYGPHGIGVLWSSPRCDLVRVAQGGPQEKKLRPGTESVALACGFAAAFETIAVGRDEEARRIGKIRDTLARELQLRIPGLVINGDLRHALPHMLSISIPDIQSEYVVLALDIAGIAVSTKSACREGEESRSHVVEALVAGDSSELWRAQNTLRISLGRVAQEKDIARIVDGIDSAVRASLMSAGVVHP